MKSRSQLTLGTGFEKYTKTTRRAQFLAEMERVMPWRELCARIEPVYPKPGNGRPPIGVERMLRMYFLQHWFNLSDRAVEEALYDSPTMLAFVGIDLGCEPVPDETTVCKFRHLLEQHWLGQDAVREHLRARPSPSALAPSSTRRSSPPRPRRRMRRARAISGCIRRKGRQWHFGMKGVDPCRDSRHPSSPLLLPLVREPPFFDEVLGQ